MVNLEISKENGPKVEFFEVKEEDSKDFEEGGNMEHPQAPLPLQQLPENLENQAQNRNLSPQPRQQPRQNLQPRQNFENRFLQPRQEEQPRQIERRHSTRLQDHRPNYQEPATDSETDSEVESSDDELLLTDQNANPNGQIAHGLYHALAAFSPPNSYLQARHSGEWNNWETAMKAELAKMEKYKVWDVVDRKPEMRVVGARWVYTRKVDGQTGLPSTYKARWVAKGYSQIKGVDFNELYAAVAHKDTI